jgi:CRP/FNR family transcriptional regulator, cyclic AMP receptor protein
MRGVVEYPSLVWHLKRTSLFEDWELADLERLSKTTPYRRFRGGDVIYHMDDPADAIYFIRSGLVKISKLFPNGKEAILGVVGQYDAFGELLLTPQERRPTQAEAIEDTVLIALPRTGLEDLLETRPKMALKFIQLMASRLFESQAWSAEVSAYSAPGRLASLLYRFALEFGKPVMDGTRVDLKLTQEDLSRMIGATRETVSHCLNRLKASGAILRTRAPFIVNQSKLETFIATEE